MPRPHGARSPRSSVARCCWPPAASLEARRGELIEVAASETGKVFAEADVEVSEAVDFANYYAATARELDRVSGAVFVPSRLTVVTPPWNFPLAIPAGGVLAALAAGSGVVFKPAPQARRCAAVLAEALWEAGVPRDVLALVDIDEGALGQRLVSHPDVDRVILTGSWETAALFRSWRPDLPLLAETSGKNAMIVMPSADLDLAASDLIKSAFGHAGPEVLGRVARDPRRTRRPLAAGSPGSSSMPPPRCASGRRPIRCPRSGPSSSRRTASSSGRSRPSTRASGGSSSRARSISDPRRRGGSGPPASAPACSRARASTARSSSDPCSASCTRTR